MATFVERERARARSLERVVESERRRQSRLSREEQERLQDRRARVVARLRKGGD